MFFFVFVSRLSAISMEYDVHLLNNSVKTNYDLLPYNINNINSMIDIQSSSYVIAGFKLNHDIGDGANIVGRFAGYYDFSKYNKEDSWIVEKEVDAKILLLNYNQYLGDNKFSFGKEISSWSVSFGANPLDISSRDRFVGKDLQNFNLDEEGMLMLQYSGLFFQDITIDIIYANDSLEYDDNEVNLATNSYLGTDQIALRANYNLSNININAIAKYHNVEGFGVGGNVSSQIGQNIQAYGEILVSQHKLSGNFNTNSFVYERDNSNNITNQLVIGSGYTPSSITGLNLSVEYLFNENGMDIDDYYDINDNLNMVFLPQNVQIMAKSSFSATYTNALPLQHYAYFRMNYVSDKYEINFDNYLAIEEFGYVVNLYFIYMPFDLFNLKSGVITTGGKDGGIHQNNPMNYKLYLVSKWNL
jgi:hypothetical protein